MKSDIKLTGDQELCFKVVIVEGGIPPVQYFSSHTFYNDQRLQYSIGKKTVPVFGKVFVFKDYSDAQLFCYKSWNHLIVFRCVGKNIRRIYRLCNDSAQTRLFWELKKRKKSSPDIFDNVNKAYRIYVSDFVIPLEIVCDNRVEN
jgi:hypothetical protein